MSDLFGNHIVGFSHEAAHLFDLWLSVRGNSYGHVRTLQPFYVTSNKHYDVMTPKMCLDNITTQANS